MPDQAPLPNGPADPADITEERAARRFHQMRHMEKAIATLDRRISDKQTELKALKEEREGKLQTMLASARDEGTLPLFEDLDS